MVEYLEKNINVLMIRFGGGFNYENSASIDINELLDSDLVAVEEE